MSTGSKRGSRRGSPFSATVRRGTRRSRRARPCRRPLAWISRWPRNDSSGWRGGGALAVLAGAVDPEQLGVRPVRCRWGSAARGARRWRSPDADGEGPGPGEGHQLARGRPGAGRGDDAQDLGLVVAVDDRTRTAVAVKTPRSARESGRYERVVGRAGVGTAEGPSESAPPVSKSLAEHAAGAGAASSVMVTCTVPGSDSTCAHGDARRDAGEGRRLLDLYGVGPGPVGDPAVGVAVQLELGGDGVQQAAALAGRGVEPALGRGRRRPCGGRGRRVAMPRARA